MKTITLKIIDFYQSILSIILKNLLGTSHFCRFRPTCSEYTKIAIKQNGILKGSMLGFMRILKCQPFGKVVYE